MQWLALSPVCGREGDHLCSVHEVEQCAVMNHSIRHCMVMLICNTANITLRLM